MERLYSVLLSILICAMSLAGCLGSNDSDNSDDDNDSDNIGNNETTILFEGDQPGECEDGADNDRDGLFDCDDPNCAGSAVCKVNEENNTNQNDNVSTEDGYSEFDDHKIVNLTNEIISSGYFDEADCNFVLFAKDWDENSYFMKQKLLDSNLGDSLNYRIWIATYEDVGYNILLPTLYDWRNGAINTTDSIGLYVFDEDEVSFLGDEFTRGTELGTICLPSQRDGLGDLFEILDPPFNWTLQVATSDDISAMNLTRAANEPLCEVIIINKHLSIGNGLDQIHDNVQTAINRVGNTEVNFWFMNSTPGEDDDPVTGAMFELNRLNGAPWDYSPYATLSFFIVDTNDTGENYFVRYVPEGEPCSSENREDIYQFFHELGYHPFHAYGYVAEFSEIIVDASIDVSYKNTTTYNNLEMDAMGYYLNVPYMHNKIHTDSALECLIHEEHDYFAITKSWSINNQSIPGDILFLSDYNVSIGDNITCSIHVQDLLTNRTTIDNIELTVSERVPIAHNLEIIQENDMIYCDFDILNPDKQNYVAIVTWLVDSNNDGRLYFDEDWYSNPSANYSLNASNGDGWPDLTQGNHISCLVEIVNPEDGELIINNGLADFLSNHNPQGDSRWQLSYGVIEDIIE